MFFGNSGVPVALKTFLIFVLAFLCCLFFPLSLQTRVFTIVSLSLRCTSAARKRDNEIKFMAPDPQRKYDNRG